MMIHRKAFSAKKILLLFSLLTFANSESFLPVEKAKLLQNQTNSRFRIVGGWSADAEQFPYQVAVNTNNIVCGGSLIRSNWVLSAAHCVFDRNNNVMSPTKFEIRAGSLYRRQGGVVRNVSKVLPHINYKSRTKYEYPYDIALLKLTQNYQLGGDIKTIALPTSSTNPGGEKTVTISGWGKVSTSGEGSSSLKYNRVTPMNSSACSVSTGKIRILCLKSAANNGACMGDSGGPAVFNNQLVGVANFVSSLGCGTDEQDGYAKVSDYLDWIKNTMNSN